MKLLVVVEFQDFYSVPWVAREMSQENGSLSCSSRCFPAVLLVFWAGQPFAGWRCPCAAGSSASLAPECQRVRGHCDHLITGVQGLLRGGRWWHCPWSRTTGTRGFGVSKGTCGI